MSQEKTPRFKIEYLTESTLEDFVCHIGWPAAENLYDAEGEARTGKEAAHRLWGANGFQIRDMADAGLIVSLETFDD